MVRASWALCAASCLVAAATADQRLISVQGAPGRRPPPKGMAAGSAGRGHKTAEYFGFELVELDPLTGVATVSPLNGSIPCVGDSRTGKTCNGAGTASNGADADLVPATDSPTGRALLVFTVQCDCPKLIGPNDWLMAKGPPVVVALDIEKKTIRHVLTLPDTLLNFAGEMGYTGVGWDRHSKHLVVVGPHSQDGSDPFANTTLVFVSVDLEGGKVASVAHGPTSCAVGRDHDPNGCEGDSPQTALGIMDRGSASAGAWIAALVHEWEDPDGIGHESYPSHLVGMNVETAENTFNTSFGASFYQMASMGDGTIVGLGLCCDYGRFGKLGCPKECGLNPPGPIRDASMAMMSWDAANRSTPPRILETHKVADLGIALVVASGGAVDAESGRYTHLAVAASPDDAGRRGLRNGPTPIGGGGFTLLSFDANTGALELSTKLIVPKGMNVHGLFFLRYV